jgi:hypothetical protein
MDRTGLHKLRSGFTAKGNSLRLLQVPPYLGELAWGNGNVRQSSVAEGQSADCDIGDPGKGVDCGLGHCLKVAEWSPTITGILLANN